MYALLEQLTLQAAFPLAALCETLEVSRAGYYAWRSESKSAQHERDRELTPLLCDIFWKHKRRYGARRIAVELGALGQPCGVDRVVNTRRNILLNQNRYATENWHAIGRKGYAHLDCDIH